MLIKIKLDRGHPIRANAADRMETPICKYNGSSNARRARQCFSTAAEAESFKWRLETNIVAVETARNTAEELVCIRKEKMTLVLAKYR